MQLILQNVSISSLASNAQLIKKETFKEYHKSLCIIIFQAKYCSESCKNADFDWFHWAECGMVDHLQDDNIGRLAFLVYRAMVKSGLEKCIDTHRADLNDTEKNGIYDSMDYASVFLQVMCFSITN